MSARTNLITRKPSQFSSDGSSDAITPYWSYTQLLLLRSIAHNPFIRIVCQSDWSIHWNDYKPFSIFIKYPCVRILFGSIKPVLKMNCLIDCYLIMIKKTPILLQNSNTIFRTKITKIQ